MTKSSKSKPTNVRIYEFDEVINLINEVFRTTHGHKPTMMEEFPLLLNKQNIENMTIIKEDNQIVSGVNFVMSIVEIENSKLDIASIGAVCTKKGYEHRGYSSEILDHVEEKIIDKGADIMLISGDRSLYTRRKCSKVKNFNKVKIQPLCILTDVISILDYEEKYLDEMYDLYNESSIKYVRSKSDFKTLLQSATMPWGSCSYKKFIIKEKDDFIGYMVLRIMDEDVRRGEIAEIYLKNFNLFDLISQVAYMENLAYIEYWLHINDKVELNEGINYSLDYLHGTIKIMNFEKLCKNLKGYFEHKVGEEIYKEIQFKDYDNKYLIQYRDEKLTIEDVSELNKLIFEGISEMEIKEKFEIRVLKEFLEKSFPLPFVWTKNLNYQ